MPEILRTSFLERTPLFQQVFFDDTILDQMYANLLIEIGTRKNVTKMLVFLANTSEATSRELERGTDMRRPEVNMAIK